MNTHILENIKIPDFSKNNRIHLKLAELSEAAHKAALSDDKDKLKNIEEEIDKCAAKLWELTEEELIEIKRSLEEI
jgi:hypothetical protein